MNARVAGAVLILLGAAGVTVEAAAADTGQIVVVRLDALNGSGESGTATLKAQGAKTVVTVSLVNGSAIEQPAHFHTGTCDKYQPRPLYPLEDVVNGKSTTTLDVPIGRLTAGDLIVNVHKSYADIATQAACGIAKP
ncbi:MAG: hypothetical protein JO029_01870 [Candidatus Eremiobacteraeota bacterium]|nr:hypothetical protein [Candidatus Eremiobacteraeota bacterium]MBV8433009.1 hypothetical protein [Candidatus Eremiobacteraeota bacterium]MBV8721522.1 hypothetical protein [Candidatus Eremiobacteraeota bacterium]